MKKIWIVIVIAITGAFAAPVGAQTWEDIHGRKIVLAGGAGSDFAHTLTLQTPTLSGSSILTFPASNASGLLTNDGLGNLLWSQLAASSISPGANNTFLVTNGSGTVAWLGLSTDATLTGTGIGTQLALNLANANIWTATQTVQKNSIAATPADGVILQNSTAASSGTPVQESPSLNFQSHVWNTTSSGSDNTFNGRMTFIPSSAATPTGKFSWSTSTGGAYTERMSLSDAGVLSASSLALTTALPIASGGTNATSMANTDGVIYYDGTKLVTSAQGASNTVLHGNAASAPSFSAVSLTADVSGQLPVANGGMNANLTAQISNGGIFYSTASAGAVLAGTSTANQVLLSGASTTPAWSSATYPASTTINQILYSSAANTIGGISTGNNGVLITSSGGVPSISSTLPAAVQGNITGTSVITSGTWNATAIDATHGGTAQTTWTTGDLLYASASNTLSKLPIGAVGEGLTVSGGVPVWDSLTKVSYLTSNLTSSASLANVTGLAFYVNANETWQFDFFVSDTSLAAATGLIFGFTGPTSPTTFSATYYDNAGVINHGTSYTQFNTAVSAAAQKPGFVTVQGIIVNAGNPGIMQLRFKSKGASNCTALVGSYVIAHRIQ